MRKVTARVIITVAENVTDDEATDLIEDALDAYGLPGTYAELDLSAREALDAVEAQKAAGPPPGTSLRYVT